MLLRIKLPKPFPIILGTIGLFLSSGQLVLALTASEVAEIAKQVTVQIDSQTPGSGVLIHQDRDRYTLLTAAHVVATEDNYLIKTPDGKQYPITNQNILRLNGVDLALVTFNSSKAYPTVEIGDSTLIDQGDQSYIAGFPMATTAIDSQVYSFSEGKVITNSQTLLADGYSLIYSNQTLPGMSGGPVLDENGQLIGIHGRADTAAQAQNPDVNPSIYIKTGFNLGIASNTFLKVTASHQPALTSRRPVTLTTSQDPQDFFVEGVSRYDDGNYQGAIESFSQALDRRPDFHLVRLHRAYAYMDYALFYATRSSEQDRGAALLDCSRYIQAQASDPRGYMCRGWANHYAINKSEAVSDFTQAINLAPNEIYTHLARGEFYSLNREYALAIDDFSQAIALAPDSARSYGLRAKAYRYSQQLQQALEDYSQSIELNPTQDRYRQERGETLLSLGNYERAIQDFSDLISQHPHLVEQRGVAYAKLGQNQKALQDLNEAVKRSPYTEGDNGFRYYYRALVFSKLGQTNAAIQDLKTAIAGFRAVPTDPPRAEEQKAIDLLNQLESER